LALRLSEGNRCHCACSPQLQGERMTMPIGPFMIIELVVYQIRLPPPITPGGALTDGEARLHPELHKVKI
jgi:hypothetical protein